MHVELNCIRRTHILISFLLETSNGGVSLDDEVHFLVLEAVSDVAVAEFVCFQAVEKLEAGP